MMINDLRSVKILIIKQLYEKINIRYSLIDVRHYFRYITNLLCLLLASRLAPRLVGCEHCSTNN